MRFQFLNQKVASRFLNLLELHNMAEAYIAALDEFSYSHEFMYIDNVTLCIL